MNLRFSKIATPEAIAPTLSIKDTSKSPPKRKHGELSVEAHCLKGLAMIDFGEKVVTVRVGPSEEIFQVHGTLLSSKSEFFRGALSAQNGFKEAQEGIVSLPEDNAFHFRSFVNWLYFSKVLVDLPSTNAEAKTSIDELIGEWILAEKLQADDFANDVIKAFISIKVEKDLTTYLEPAQIRTIYQNTLASSSLRQVVVDLYAFHGGPEWLPDLADSPMPRQFLLDLSVALLANRSPRTKKSPLIESPCRYHKHKLGKDCCDSP